MKTKRTNKLLVLVISLMMIVTLLAGLSITASAEETGTETNTPVAEFVGQQVNLGGDISMKFYVRNNEDRPIESITVEVEFLGKLTYITECEKHPTDAKVYIYTFEGINPQCLGDLMNVTILVGGIPEGHEKAMLTGYSVKENLINAYNITNDANMKQLIIDTLEYGAAAQVYRNYKTDALVTDGVTFLSEGKTEVDVPRSSPVVNETVADSIKEATVNFSATNFIKVSYNDGEIKTLTSDAVAAYDFAKKMQFSADGLFTLGYSVNDYCYDAINSETTSDNMKALAQALYNYGLSAHFVKGNHSGGEDTATCIHSTICEICAHEYGDSRNPDNHASNVYTYTDNGDGTHTKTHECGVVIDETEEHTIENHVCTACGAMEIVVSFNADGYEWKSGDQIKIEKTVGYDSDYYTYTASVDESGTLTWTPDKKLYWNGEDEYILAAFYPAVGQDDYRSFELPEDQSTLEKLKSADCMNAVWIGKPTTDLINFQMKHRLSMITIDYDFASEFTNATIDYAQVIPSDPFVMFDAKDGGKMDEPYGVFGTTIDAYHDAVNKTIQAIVIPCTYPEGQLFIKISVNGEELQVKMPEAKIFEEGTNYTFKILITADGAYIVCNDGCSFEYTDNGDGTHKKVCAVCAYVENATEAHDHTNGKCVCGKKATPTYEVPTGLTAIYGQTLADVALPEGFTWQDATTTEVGYVGTRTFKATYTPTDTENYEIVTDIEITITVKQDPKTEEFDGEWVTVPTT